MTTEAPVRRRRAKRRDTRRSMVRMARTARGEKRAGLLLYYYCCSGAPLLQAQEPTFLLFKERKFRSDVSVDPNPRLFDAHGSLWVVSEEGPTWNRGWQGLQRYFPWEDGCQAPCIIRNWTEFKDLPMYSKDGFCLSFKCSAQDMIRTSQVKPEGTKRVPEGLWFHCMQFHAVDVTGATSLHHLQEHHLTLHYLTLHHIYISTS